MQKLYLGDSVYAACDGYGIILTTENGMGPSNTIYLEPSVFSALSDYVRALTTKDEDPEEETEELPDVETEDEPEAGGSIRAEGTQQR